MFSKPILAVFLTGLTALSSPGQVLVGANDVLASNMTPRAYVQINAQLRAALRREATEKNAAAWAATVVELTALYCELMQDPRLATSDTLESYRAKLRHRLLQVQKQLRRDLQRSSDRRAHPTASDPEAAEAVARQLASQASMSGTGLGAPSILFNLPSGTLNGYRGGAARSDYGPLLVDLIQRTIAPEFWNVNGGPGSIVYYPLWYALVVRANGEVHGRVGQLTGRLRTGH